VKGKKTIGEGRKRIHNNEPSSVTEELGRIAPEQALEEEHAPSGT